MLLLILKIFENNRIASLNFIIKIFLTNILSFNNLFNFFWGILLAKISFEGRSRTKD